MIVLWKSINNWWLNFIHQSHNHVIAASAGAYHLPVSCTRQPMSAQYGAKLPRRPAQRQSSPLSHWTFSDVGWKLNCSPVHFRTDDKLVKWLTSAWLSFYSLLLLQPWSFFYYNIALTFITNNNNNNCLTAQCSHATICRQWMRRAIDSRLSSHRQQ